MSSGLFKMLPTNYLFTNHMFNIYMYKQDLALNNQQGLICYKALSINKPINKLEIIKQMKVGSLHGILAYVLDCDVIVSKFKL